MSASATATAAFIDAPGAEPRLGQLVLPARAAEHHAGRGPRRTAEPPRPRHRVGQLPLDAPRGGVRAGQRVRRHRAGVRPPRSGHPRLRRVPRVSLAPRERWPPTCSSTTTTCWSCPTGLDPVLGGRCRQRRRRGLPAAGRAGLADAGGAGARPGRHRSRRTAGRPDRPPQGRGPGRRRRPQPAGPRAPA